MAEPAYPAARAIAPRILAYFTHHPEGRSAPPASVIETLIDAAFWASLRREEGAMPKISLAYVSPEDTGEPLLFAAIIGNALLGAGALLFGVTGWAGVWGLTPFMFLYCAMIGCINPTSAGLTMQHFGHAAGMTSALIGIVLYGTGTLASLAMGAFPNPVTPIPMTALICGFSIAGLATYLLFRPRAAG